MLLLELWSVGAVQFALSQAGRSEPCTSVQEDRTLLSLLLFAID